MKELNSGDTLIWPDGKRVTVRNVREGDNGERFCDFHEISCDWTVRQLAAIGCFDDVLRKAWRERYRKVIEIENQFNHIPGFIDEIKKAIDAQHPDPSNADEPVNDYPSKICIASSNFSSFTKCLEYQYFTEGLEYQYYERVFSVGGGEFAVIDKQGEWHYFDREDFERCFTIKQPKRTDWQPPGPPDYKGS